MAARADRVIFLKDGDIHDEFELGKYKGNKIDKPIREKRLYQWLDKQGF